jgi:hypothetical protein
MMDRLFILDDLIYPPVFTFIFFVTSMPWSATHFDLSAF